MGGAYHFALKLNMLSGTTASARIPITKGINSLVNGRTGNLRAPHPMMGNSYLMLIGKTRINIVIISRFSKTGLSQMENQKMVGFQSGLKSSSSFTEKVASIGETRLPELLIPKGQ